MLQDPNKQNIPYQNRNPSIHLEFDMEGHSLFPSNRYSVILLSIVMVFFW